MSNARTDHAAADLAMRDHFPTCPRCGDLCGRMAYRCSDCGAKLYEQAEPAWLEDVPPTIGEDDSP